MNRKIPQCTCGMSLPVGSFLPRGFLYQCHCGRRWLRTSTESWVEVVGLLLSDGQIWTNDHE